MNYLTRNGQTVSLAKRPLGRGGEGQIIPVEGAPLVVAKIFHSPTPERCRKIELLIANPPLWTNGHVSVAWPQELLFTNEAQPRFAGYLMPRIEKARPSFLYYNPELRRAQCPGFDYRYLVRTACNLALAVAQVHSRGYVIGDLNESNVFIGLDTFVTLLDVDSWQVVDRSGGITYRAWGAKGEFLAPELHGRDLTTLDRLPLHDNFALAVAVFKLLNEGTHPFEGVFHGKGDPPAIEARIKSGSFPYRDHARLWTPKPLAPSFDALHPELKQLFVQTFELGHSKPQLRPNAKTWGRALANAETELRTRCGGSSHWCWSSTCTWCGRREQLSGLDPFPGNWAGRSVREQPRRVATPVQRHPCLRTPAFPAQQVPVLMAKFAHKIGQAVGLPPEVVIAVGVMAAGILALITFLQLFTHE